MAGVLVTRRDVRLAASASLSAPVALGAVLEAARRIAPRWICPRGSTLPHIASFCLGLFGVDTCLEELFRVCFCWSGHCCGCPSFVPGHIRTIEGAVERAGGFRVASRFFPSSGACGGVMVPSFSSVSISAGRRGSTESCSGRKVPADNCDIHLSLQLRNWGHQYRGMF